jgi:hypothetical protein
MIELRLPYLPPSVNELYRPMIKGTGLKKIAILALSATGTKFKKEAVSYLVKNCQQQMRWFKPGGTYVLFAQFEIPNLENKGWPTKTASRYKRTDVSNRVKVLEDVIAEASAIDDSNYMMSVSRKCVGVTPATNIWIWNLDGEGCPFLTAASSLQ